MGDQSTGREMWRLRRERPEVGFDAYGPWTCWDEAVKAWSWAKDLAGPPLGLERWDGRSARRVEIDSEAMARELARQRGF